MFSREVHGLTHGVGHIAVAGDEARDEARTPAIATFDIPQRALDAIFLDY